MIEDQDRDFMRRLCRELDARFPGVKAAFEEFLSPDLGGERDGFLVVEVFNVPQAESEAVLEAAEAMAYDHLLAGGAFITLSLWTPEETQQHFAEEVAHQYRLMTLKSDIAIRGDSPITPSEKTLSYALGMRAPTDLAKPSSNWECNLDLDHTQPVSTDERYCYGRAA